MHEVGREFRDMVKRHAHGFQHHAHVLEDLQELCLEIVIAHDLSAVADRELARNEIDIAGRNAGRMAVQALGGRRAFWIDVSDVGGHVGRSFSGG